MEQEDNSEFFSISIEYFATGEGLHNYAAIIRASDRNEAVKLFRSEFKKLRSKEAWDFFSKGLEVRNGIHLYMKKFFNEKSFNFIIENPVSRMTMIVLKHEAHFASPL